jgi:hypothetical protein
MSSTDQFKQNGQAQMAHTVAMSYGWDGDVYVVAATKGKQTEYWAAAVPRHRALDEVERLLPLGWRAALSRRHLTPEMISDLKMRAGSVRQLKSIR